MTEQTESASMRSPSDDMRWSRQLLETLATDSLVERRRARRWSVFFRLLYLALFVLAALFIVGALARDKLVAVGPHAAVVELRGVIEAGGAASAEKINDALAAAFDAPQSRGVILRINSPGGSPVQAGKIFDELRRLRALHPDKPVHAVVEEICASGGYYVAAAADQIHVDKASLVGSIGVLMDGYGFTGAMERLGIERRLLTAGSNKGFLDPFSPLDETQRLHAQKMLDEIHQQFIAAVRLGRGSRLREQPELFSGLIWTGPRAIELGLADATGSVRSVARDILKVDDLYDYTPRESVAERVAKQFGSQLGTALERALGETGILGRTPSLR